MVVWSQVKVRGRWLSPRPIGCTPSLSVTQKCHCSCSCGLLVLCAFALSVGHVWKFQTFGRLAVGWVGLSQLLCWFLSSVGTVGTNYYEFKTCFCTFFLLF